MTVFFRGKARTAPFPKVAYCEFQIDGRRTVTRLGRVESWEHARREETHRRSDVYRKVHPAPLDTGRMTVRTWFDEHFVPHLFPTPNENRRHVVSIGRAIAAELGSLSLAKVTSADVLRWRDARLKVVSVNQVHRERYWLRRMFRHAIASDLITKNPAAALPLPRFQRPRRRLLEPHQDATLLDKVLPTRSTLRDMIELDLYTALRRAEVCALTLGEVRLKDRALAVWQSKTQTHKIIPLIPEALAIVKRHYRAGEPDEPLFRSRLKRAYRPQTLWWAYADARRAAKLHGVRLHDLRHTVAMRLLERGMEVADVGDILGHAPPYKTTWLYVAHVNSARKREAMEALRPNRKSEQMAPRRRTVSTLRRRSRG